MLKPFFSKKGHLGKTTDEVKEAINAAANLPVASSEDVGKNLVIDDKGKIVVQNEFIFEITESGGVYTTTVTPNELSEHYQKGEKIIGSVSGVNFYDFTFFVRPDGTLVPAPIIMRDSAIYPNGVLLINYSVTVDHDDPYIIHIYLIPFAT